MSATRGARLRVNATSAHSPRAGPGSLAAFVWAGWVMLIHYSLLIDSSQLSIPRLIARQAAGLVVRPSCSHLAVVAVIASLLPPTVSPASSHHAPTLNILPLRPAATPYPHFSTSNFPLLRSTVVCPLSPCRERPRELARPRPGLPTSWPTILCPAPRQRHSRWRESWWFRRS